MKHMEFPTFTVHLNGEAPAIGCGRRIVEVKHLGWKWVYAREKRRGASNFTKLPRDLWDEVVLERIDDGGPIA